ncbi:DotU family type IV/VI secretion system protein [Phaeospirillum tilakii]|uniref:DotU family type IV/VI secretion system protein n=1 Tax=Phaeospirillum tilakii TaxID=741673 RepID=A0ABW5CB06_9PROT
MSGPPRPLPQAKKAIDRFLAFHAELVAVKRLADAMVAPDGEVGAAGTAAPADAPPGDAPPAALAETGGDMGGEPAPPPATIDLFLRLRVAICPQGTPTPVPDGTVDIGYVMAALGDEALLLDVEWPGRSQWLGLLLEQSLYGTRLAGERIFDLAEQLIDGRLPGRPDLAAAILIALSLGFRGKLRGRGAEAEIARMRRGLYELAYTQPPPRRIDWSAAFAAAAEPVLPGERMRPLPRLAPWLGGIGLVLALYLAASSLVWWQATRPALGLADRIRILGGGGS